MSIEIIIKHLIGQILSIKHVIDQYKLKEIKSVFFIN